MSRGYLNHRFSDDLDLFVNHFSDFRKETDSALSDLTKAGIRFKEHGSYVSESYVKVFLYEEESPDTVLQVDFVNDVSVHHGKIMATSVFERTDSIENILSNKVGALMERTEAKDVVDIWTIARNYPFNWETVVKQAEQKEAATDTRYIVGIISTLPEANFNAINWVSKGPEYSAYLKDIDDLRRDILELKDNSLFQNA